MYTRFLKLAPRAKDGSEIDVALTICPFHNAIGSIVGALVLARSVARRKEVDKHFRLAVEASPSGMLQVDQEARSNSSTRKPNGCSATVMRS